MTQPEIDAFLANPLTMAASLLGEATTRIIYDLEQFRTDGQPLVAATIAREVHVSNLPAGTQSKVQVSFSYSDGFGREVQKKIQAERGNAPEREVNTANPNRPGKPVVENGKLKLVLTDARWVGNGRTIFNNKGKPVKQYEPFFSATHLYEDEAEMVMTGVTPILFYDPLERVVATLHPNHTYEKVVFDPWQQVTWDVNDTVVQTELNTIANDPKTDPHVGEFFRRLPDRDYLPTWYSRFSTSAIASEKDAAQKALAHAGTSAIAHLDTLGRTFLTIADNGSAGKYETRMELDLEGNTLVVTDHRKNAVMIYAIVQKDAQGQPVKDAQGKPILVGRAFDLLGHNLYSYSMDAGDRWILNNVAGKPMRAWNDRQTRYDLPQPPKGHVVRTVYDALQRPTHLYLKRSGEPEILVERLVYGENHPEAKQRNLKGRPFQHYDGAGVVSNWEFDFKGNSLRGSRQLTQEYYKQLVNWMALAELTEIPQLVQAAIALLEQKTFDSSTTFDALNRPTFLTTPDRSIIHPIFNEANLLEKVEVQLQGSGTSTEFVTNIDYDAKGQRQLIEYGNGVKTKYSYDAQTFRLVQLLTTRLDNNQPIRLQDLSYIYDPVGNITTTRDDAQQTIYFNGEVVSPSTQYEYDALYRLISAKGREHIGQTTNQPIETRASLKPQYDANDWTRRNLPHPNDAQAMRNYTELYEYDGVGNILAMIHQAIGGDWTRRYDYEATNNRLRTTSLPSDGDDVKLLPSRYRYDLHGNMIQMPHLPLMQWDFKDQLQATSPQVRNDGGKPKITYFVYDASGQRVRKVTERQADAGQTPTRMKERIYLGGFKVYREYNGDGTTMTLERETLHIMDDKQRIALVETRTQGNDDSPRQLNRYQLGNHLGSASLELSDLGAIVSYEEYYPYGSTSYQGGRSVAEVGLKRYRYTGKERDGETGLYYHGARYYAAWLGRWVSCDPIGIAGGINVFVYTSNSPINRIDPNGMEDCTASPFVCDPAKYKPSSSSPKAAAFGFKEWEAKERLKMETELSRYGQGCVDNESFLDLQSRLFQARAKATLVKQDMAPVQTVDVDTGPVIKRGIIVVHPSAVDANVWEEVEFVGTDEQRAAKQIEVDVEAFESSFKAAVGGALQMGVARQANKAAGQPQIDPRLTQSGAPVDNTPMSKVPQAKPESTAKSWQDFLPAAIDRNSKYRGGNRNIVASAKGAEETQAPAVEELVPSLRPDREAGTTPHPFGETGKLLHPHIFDIIADLQAARAGDASATARLATRNPHPMTGDPTLKGFTSLNIMGSAVGARFLYRNDARGFFWKVGDTHRK